MNTNTNTNTNININTNTKLNLQGETMNTAGNTKLFGAPAGTFAESGISLFQGYDSQLSIPEIAGTRIVKCLYQVNTKTGKKLRENSYIRIPTGHITEQTVVDRINELAGFIVSYLQEKEDSIIKDAHREGQLNFHLASLSMDRVIELLEESETSGRFNKEMIESWYGEHIEANLGELFADKLGIDINDTSVETELGLIKLQKILDAYKAKFASLASPKVALKEADCAALIKVIKEADTEGTFIGKKFISKLENMKVKVEETLLTL